MSFRDEIKNAERVYCDCESGVAEVLDAIERLKAVKTRRTSNQGSSNQEGVKRAWIANLEKKLEG